ncbi:MAG: ABC transporter ATP-binding protein [Lachnospiraceae bacterium]|nr:ABC transporter ATP-binding protein [Lachnospiraceae bacterium]
MSDTAIRVADVSKMYKLFDKKTDRIWDALGIGGKRYEEKYALHHLDFEIKKGETVGIIGTNGAGKSTLLKIITGVVYPTEGDVEINGKISALLELGAGFNYEYTGLENVYLNGLMTGLSKKQVDEKLDAVLEFADIGKYIYQPVKSYSSGMFVRLAFAVAINVDPDILIVDEALSVGDVFFQAKCYRKFEEFKRLGKTILFVSHDLSTITRYCDRAILLNKGHMLSEGTPKDMVDLYKKVLAKAADVEDIEAGGDIKKTNQKTGILSEEKKDDTWKSHFKINPTVDEYGNGSAKIVDFGIFDDKGLVTDTIHKGSKFTIRSKVRFLKEVEDPIFTYAFKNIQGVSITGTNTMYEGILTGTAKEGDEYVAEFTQEMNLQGGEYLLSISCTGYAGGEFLVYYRLYDVISVTVVSMQDTVGFYDMFSETTVTKNGEKLKKE